MTSRETAPEQSIADLVRRAQERDEGAFATLMRQLQDMAVGFAYARLGDRHAAEDAAQDAFLDVYRLLPSLREPAAFVAWLRRILIKHCDRQSRRRAWNAEQMSEDGMTTIPDPAPNTLHAIVQAERETLVRSIVGALPERLRTVVALYYFGDRSVDQIANFLEIPHGTVKSRLAAARASMRAMAERQVELSMTSRRPSRDESFVQRVRRVLIAAADGDSELLAALLADDASAASVAGPHPFWGGMPNALQVAAEWGRTAIVRQLLDAGIDPDARPSSGGYDGWSALQLALVKGHTDTGRLLISRGATVDVWSAALLGDARRIADALRDDPRLVAARGPAGATPLHFAATAEVAALLVARGADPTARGDSGWTPLESAAFAGASRRPAARWLLDRFGGLDIAVAAALDDPELIRRAMDDPSAVDRANLNVDGATHAEGARPLHIAAALGNLDAVAALLAAGADPNAPTGNGHLPMHMAAKGGSRPVVEALLAAGADPARRDGEHHSLPAEWADFFGHADLAKWLGALSCDVLVERPPTP